MDELKNLRFSFLVIAFLLCNIIVLPFDFFAPFKIELPFLGFYLLQTSLAMIIVFLSFAKAPIASILRICVAFLVFISFCFAAQGFLPFAAEHKLLSFASMENFFKAKVAINIIGLTALNLATSILFASELLRKEPQQSQTAQDFEAYQNQEQAPSDHGLYDHFDQDYYQEPSDEEIGRLALEHDLEMVAEQPQAESFQEMASYNQDLENYYEEEVEEKEINSLFDLYLDDYENKSSQEINTEGLGDIENLLVENLKDGVTGAMFLNANADALHDDIFNWQGFPKEKLIQLFQENNQLSHDLEEGSLCQMLFSDGQYWYLIAKYRSNYLLLQTDEREPDLLLENCFHLVQAIKHKTTA